MSSPHRHTTTYDSTRIDGNAIAILGNIQGDIHFPERPSEPFLNQCLRDLRVTDPREDWARIESNKDRLLKDCYAWILDDVGFQQWRTQSESRLLWIKGDPGKGKTMMTMGLIDELSQPRPSHEAVPEATVLSDNSTTLLSFFFCQNTVPALNNAVSVLRGLIFMLAVQRGNLLQHVQERYRYAGKQLFEGPNAVYALKEMLSDMLNDASVPATYLLVDALDECTSGLSELLHIITDASLGRRSRVKWLVTSRNIPEIERYLQPDSLGVKVSLEVKASYVLRAVAAFVEYKVQRLAAVQQYDLGLQAEVQQQLRDKAEGTFLWVSLVCKELEKVPFYRTRAVLQALPPGLDPLYERMMTQIAAQDAETAGYCRDILRSITLAFRPLQLEELAVAAGLPKDQFRDVQAVVDLVSRCYSFLTVREGVLSFIHLSAKDFFTLGNGRQVFDGTLEEEQARITDRLLDAMDSTLRRDICNLQKPGLRVQEAKSRVRSSCLRQIAYACEYWVEHLQAGGRVCSNMLVDGGKVHRFFQKHLLHWLEAVSLLQKMPEAILVLQQLEVALTRVESTTVLSVVHDALRFAMWSGSGIQEAPLQVYYGALVFAPRQSIVRQQFAFEMPEWVQVLAGLEEDWGPLLQTLEGHTGLVNYVTLSAHGDRLASASDDKTVQVWDSKTGKPLCTLKGHTSAVKSVAFTVAGDKLASASWDRTARVWNAQTGQPLYTLEGHTGGVNSVAFSAAGDRLASASEDMTVRVWDANTGQPLHTLEGHTGTITSVIFLAGGNQLASASHDKTVRIWNIMERRELCISDCHSKAVNSIALSTQGDQLASASDDHTVQLWNTWNWTPGRLLRGHSQPVNAVAFTSHGGRLASCSDDHTVRLWDTSTGQTTWMLDGYTEPIRSLAFSGRYGRLASVSCDESVRLWDLTTGQTVQTLEGRIDTNAINDTSFLWPDYSTVPSSCDNTGLQWDKEAGRLYAQTHVNNTYLFPFAQWDLGEDMDMRQHADTLHVQEHYLEPTPYDLQGQACGTDTWQHAYTQQTHIRHESPVSNLAFSTLGDRLATASDNGTVLVWDTHSGRSFQILKGHTAPISTLSFSRQGNRLATASADHTVRVWDVVTGEEIQKLEGYGWTPRITFDSEFAQDPPALQSYVSSAAPQHPMPQYIVVNNSWVVMDLTKTLWLPANYRCSCTVSQDKMVAFGYPSGRIMLLEFS